MSNCKVWLDNYNGQYFPGNLIQGKFICNLDSESPLRAVKIRIVGSEHTEWLGEQKTTNPTDNSTKNETCNFIGDNNFLFHEIILYGAETGSTSLSAGQHIYPFSYNLPHNLPTSFGCPNGNITYRVHGIVDRPMRQDFEDQFLFVVNAPIDLNRVEQTPDLLGPSSYSDEKTVCCFCCASGPISMDVQLPKKACIPGETVSMHVRISNQSNVNVDSLKVTLKQRLTFMANVPSTSEKVDGRDLATVQDVGVGAHGEHTYNVQLPIPPETFLPNFDQCKLFKASHIYEVRAALPSYHKDLVIKIKPIVGNIPPGGQLPPQPPAGESQGQPGGFPPATAPGGFPPQGPPPGGIPAQGAPGGFPPQGYPGGPGGPPQGFPPQGYPGGPPPPGGYPYPGGDPQGYPGGAPPQGYPGGAPSQGYPGGPPGPMGFASPGGVYPQLPAQPGAPTAPTNGYSKAQEAGETTNSRDLPPSYDSVKPQ